MIKATLVLLFNSKNQILLAMKKKSFGKGKRNGPGGKIEKDELPIDGAIRELEEETLIKLSSNDLTHRGLFHCFFDSNPEWNQDIYLFTGNYNGDFSETTEMKPEWFDIDSIPYDNMWEDDSIWLPRILKGDNYVEYNFYFLADGKIYNIDLIN